MNQEFFPVNVISPWFSLLIYHWVDERRLGGVVASVLATELKGCGFEPGQGDGFLRAMKIRSTLSSWMGSKARKSHVVRS
jgi:hypothetical protein